MEKCELIVLKSTNRFEIYSVITLEEASIKILRTKNILRKVSLTFFFSKKWKDKEINEIKDEKIERRREDDKEDFIIPNKPLREEIILKKNENNSLNKNQIINLIHGIAHAESYAIELFWDCIGRFINYNLPLEFYNEMVVIAEQEAKHFLLWYNRLIELNCPYGSLWSHEGLWKSAEETKHRS